MYLITNTNVIININAITNINVLQNQINHLYDGCVDWHISCLWLTLSLTHFDLYHIVF